MENCIAERHLVLEIIETGERRNLVIRIGMPYWLPEDPFASCPREYEGLFNQVADAKGMDLLHALHLATDIDSVLKFQTKYKFYWPDGTPYFEEVGGEISFFDRKVWTERSYQERLIIY